MNDIKKIKSDKDGYVKSLRKTVKENKKGFVYKLRALVKEYKIEV